MILILQRDQNSLHYLPLIVFFFQRINEPAHIQTNRTSCCDLVFTYKPGLLVDSGVHHQIIYYIFNLNICYPLRYQQLVWDYKKADSNHIRTVFDFVHWERLFDQKKY